MIMTHDPSESFAAGRFLELRRRDGWEFARRRVGKMVVGVIAIDADERIVLVEQFRPAIGSNAIELPAGLVGDDPRRPAEDDEQAARRELLEETGFEASSWTRLPAVVSSAGLTDERVQLFLARDLRRSGSGGGIDDENITVHLISMSDLTGWLARMIEAGCSVDGRVYAAPTLAGS